LNERKGHGIAAQQYGHIQHESPVNLLTCTSVCQTDGSCNPRRRPRASAPVNDDGPFTWCRVSNFHHVETAGAKIVGEALRESRISTGIEHLHLNTAGSGNDAARLFCAAGAESRVRHQIDSNRKEGKQYSPRPREDVLESRRE